MDTSNRGLQLDMHGQDRPGLVTLGKVALLLLGAGLLLRRYLGPDIERYLKMRAM